MRRIVFVACVVVMLVPSAPRAQDGEAPRRNVVVEVAEDERRTPQSSLRAFRLLAAGEDFVAAATWFPADSALSGRVEGARRLAEVLDASGDEAVRASDAADGRLDDGLAADLDVVARVAVGRGSDTLHMQRAAGRWGFPATVLAQVAGWHDAHEHRWLRERLPAGLFAVGWRGLLWWQWLALPLLALVSALLGRVVAWVLRWLAKWIAARTRFAFDDRLAEELDGPLLLLAASIVAGVLARFLVTSGPGLLFLLALTQALDLLALFWAALRAIDAFVAVMKESEFVRERPESRSFVTLGAQVAKAVVAFLGIVVALQRLGVPVTSLLAGLGIGGLALALAAQKTVENVFGSVTLGVDQPFRPGDFVKIDDFVGTVETVGLRSTRIRTLDRTLITLPNGKLADMKIESYAARDRFRFHQVLWLPQVTPPERVRAIVADVRAVLEAHPNRGDDASVFLKRFSDAGFEVEVMAWIKVPEFREFQAIRQDLLLALLGIVERNGSSISFPARTVHHVWPPS